MKMMMMVKKVFRVRKILWMKLKNVRDRRNDASHEGTP